MTEKIKCQKIDKYFYKDRNGNILKYSNYCIEKNCKTESSYNYENEKPIYCNKHKKEKMVNTKRKHKLCQNCKNGYLNKCDTPKCKYTIEKYKNFTKYMKQKIIKYLKENNIEFYRCRICLEIGDQKHFHTKEDIEKFNSVTKKFKCQKIDKYFYKDINGNILKYSNYCIEKNCKTLSSYNYENEKPIYCNKHKKEKMVNTKLKHKLCKNCDNGYKIKCNSPKCKYTIKNYKNATKYTKQKIIKYLKENKIEFYMCRICADIVDKDHFDTEEHIGKFDSVCKINIEKSLQKSFIKIKCKFIDTRYNYIYTDLYLKKHIKELILKNIDTTKYYKSFIIKQNILEFNQGSREPLYISEKFNSNDLLQDVSNLEDLEKKKII